MKNSLRQKLNYKYLLNTFGLVRTKEILQVNPTIAPVREANANVTIDVFEYNASSCKHYKNVSLSQCQNFQNEDSIKWINIDGIDKKTIETICKQFDVHYLIAEDIESVGQRPKVEEQNNHLFCLLQMLYFNIENSSVEGEQISIILGKNYVISFQEDETRDVFDGLRAKLNATGSRIREKHADYLCYTMLDIIVDHYFIVMEQLGEKIESIEEEIIRTPNTRSLAKINQLRKELIVLKRSVAPVRELVSSLIRTESSLIDDNTVKYLKDVYDHIIQANDLVENYRDIMTTMQDLYINQVNLKMNEVMKVMTIVTCLLAPATVIGGIFGMNFDRIPYLHNQYGFYLAVGLMLLIPIAMIMVFKKRGWF